jgi:signal transduction histidine kinase
MKEYSAALKSRTFLIGSILKYQLEKLLKYDIQLNELIGFNEQCQEVINNYGDITYAMVVDLNGKILFHNNPLRHGETIKYLKIPELLESNKEVLQQYNENGDNFYNFIIPILGLSRAPIAAVIIGFPASLISQKTALMVGDSALVAIIFLSLGGIALILLLRLWVTNPLDQLLKAIKEIQSSGTDRPKLVTIKSKDEFGDLGQAFNEMVLQLKESHARVRNYTQELEFKVQQSTSHLKEANDKLRQDIQVRKQAEAKIISQREELRGLAVRLAEVEESERQRLAREIHYDVCQNLACIAITLETLKLRAQQEPPDRLLSRLSDAADLIEETGGITRDIMEGLRPTVLDHYGLMRGLRQLGEQFIKKTGIDIEILGEEANPRLTPKVELALFSIAQEALNNVAKHARATRVILSKEEKAGMVRLIIADNGIGFNQTQVGQPMKGKKWGLLTMGERARAVGGTFYIESQPGQGTRVIMEVSR